jgi:regulatory protein
MSIDEISEDDSRKVNNKQCRKENISNESVKRALNYSFFLLKYRPRSKGEILSRLKKKKFPPPVVSKVIDYLEERGYINDKEFVTVFINSAIEKGWGKRRIWFVLRRLDISKELIEEHLKDTDVFRKKIKEIVERKIGYYKNKSVGKQSKKNIFDKVLRYLLSRGFDYDDITQVMEGMEIDRFK